VPVGTGDVVRGLRFGQACNVIIQFEGKEVKGVGSRRGAGANLVGSPVIPLLSAVELPLLVISRFKNSVRRPGNTSGTLWFMYLGRNSLVISGWSYVASSKRDIVSSRSLEGLSR